VSQYGAEYDAGADAWAGAPARVYARFATAMMEDSPVAVSGAKVLDVGAGTGVACDAALALGARRAVASDISIEMLRHRAPDIPAVVADGARLPFADASFDLVLSAFSLTHLPDPAAALAEWRRVAPAALIVTFAPGPSHPAKVAIDAVMARFGFVSPPWYEQLKSELEPLVEDTSSLTAMVRSTGYREIEVTVRTVDTGLRTPSDIVDWRLGMAQLAQFVDGLPESRRDQARRAAEDAVAELAPVQLDIQVLSAS
jgi:demethylmenaquinone methyltransferase/2-methoxy-6-polyprenyl-1,4-benzoquinol methylase